ncbi:MAG: hypothetical protein H7A25_10580 [Leptospiraceae bacterium]|nr:hypothetical protein [Leptospiraceae bacterium]MCP5500339.1 hypothetical protein [Leptospiraceae bacterium]
MENKEFLERVIKLCSIQLPYFSGLIQKVLISEHKEIPTAGITVTGRMVINPDWFYLLDLPTATFIFAHELYHLALRTHDRGKGSIHRLFNIAHDLVINRKLKKELNFDSVPVGGLDIESILKHQTHLHDASAEEIYYYLKENNPQHISSKDHWTNIQITTNAGSNLPSQGGAMADALRKALQKGKPASEDNLDKLGGHSDIIDEELERRLFPNETRTSLKQKERIEEIEKACNNALSMKATQEEFEKLFGMPGYGKDNVAGEMEDSIDMLRSYYRPPWEMALQQWMENTTRTGKTYSRASRRGTGYDFVLPGHKREGYTIHILLDTSGSMYDTLSRILGVIASFCDSLMIPEIHLLQCDTEVTSDEWLSPEELQNYTIRGMGGSDMTPGMEYLAQDPEVENLIVITDGYIDYPDEAMPYEVLWVLTEEYDFRPAYGKIIQLEGED